MGSLTDGSKKSITRRLVRLPMIVTLIVLSGFAAAILSSTYLLDHSSNRLPIKPPPPGSAF